MQQYANTEKSIPEIAEELNVETVMEGSVRYANGQIRITTQLSSSALSVIVDNIGFSKQDPAFPNTQ